jgi:hypothetical protein
VSSPASQEVRETCRDDVNDWVTVNDISKHENVGRRIGHSHASIL